MDEKADNLIPIIVGIFVLVITLVIFLIYRQRKTTRNCILLTGLCDSGKTLLYAQLLHNKFVHTQTSIQENIGQYVVNNVSLKVVDIPGHERLRDKFVEQYKNFTKAIVFVIDSTTIQQDIRDVAEFLYNILVDPIVARNSPNLLILCNKQDQTLSKGCNAVKSILEKELNTLRVSKSSQLESIDPKMKKAATLGSVDKEFSFSNLHFKTEFAESAAFNKNGSVDVEHLKKWLLKIG